MNTVFRNFVSALSRYKMATFLNVTGLSVAFAAFIILIMQVYHDWGYDRFHKDANLIYRVEYMSDDNALATLPRPLIDAFITSSPHIRMGTLIKKWDNQRNVAVENGGVRKGFLEFYQEVYPGYTELFDFEMVEGDRMALVEPEKVLIPESMARKFFPGGSAVGKSLVSDELKAEIGGVYRDFPQNSMIGNAIYKKISDKEGAGEWQFHNYECYVLVDNPKNVSDIINSFETGFKHEAFDWEKSGLRLTNLPEIYYLPDIVFDSQTTKGSRLQVLILFCVALLIIVIAVINYTNFSNALIPVRLKSINTRKVLGCSDNILRISIVVESIVLCLISYCISLILVYSLSNTPFSHTVNGGIDLSSHIYLLTGIGFFAFFVGLLSGIWPAFYITSFSPALVLKGSFGLSPKGRTLRSLLVGIQFVVSFAFIVSAIFVGLQNRRMIQTPLGFDQSQLAVVKLNKKLAENTDLLCQRLNTLTGIVEVATVDRFIGSGDDYSTNTIIHKGEKIQYKQIYADPSILKVLDIHVTEGRGFLPEDKNGDGVFIFNEAARNALDLEIGDNIIGFANDIKYNSYRNDLGAFAFYVGGRFGNSFRNYALIRIQEKVNYESLVENIHKTLTEIDPDYPMEISLYNDIINDLYESELILGRQISFFGLIAFLLSIIGVFGVVLFEVEYKRKEIGVRRVFGSTIREILQLLNNHYFRILVISFVLASPIAYFVIDNWLKNFSSKTPLHWWVFAMTFLIVLVVTSATVTLQSWRVASANPVESIKTE